MAPVTVLYEDAVCIVVVKPPGMASQTDRSSAPDMVSWLKNYLSRKQKGKEPYVGVVHRLDRPVGGVMVYALTKAAAADLSGQIRQNLMQKSYLAVLKGRPAQTEGSCTDWLKKDGKTVADRIEASLEEEQLKGSEAGKKIFQTNLYHYAGAGHLAIDYPHLMRVGFQGTLEEARTKLSALSKRDPEYPAKTEFYRAVIIMYEAVIRYVKRYADLAEEQAASCTDETRKKELEEEREEIKNRSEYMKTDAYIEDVAREKFGLAYDDEIIFKAAESE